MTSGSGCVSPEGIVLLEFLWFMLGILFMAVLLYVYELLKTFKIKDVLTKVKRFRR